MPYFTSEFDLEEVKCTQDAEPIFDDVREILVHSFANEGNLWEVSTNVVKKLREKVGGNWICDIQPADIEEGLNFHKSKYMRLNFERNNLQYRIVIA